MRLRVRLWLPGLLLAALAAACGGGTSSPPPARVVPAPTATPSLPSSTTAAVTVGSAAATATFAPIAAASIGGGISASIRFPAAASGSGTVSMTFRDAPAPAPALQDLGRRPRDIGAPGITGFAYITLTSSSDVTMTATPELAFSAPAAAALPSGTQAYIAIYVPPAAPRFANYAPPGTWSPVAGPVTIGGGVSTWTFPASSLTYTFSAGVAYTFGLFTATGAPITPAPSPTATPTPSLTPSPSPTATPKATASPRPTGSPTAKPTASPTASPSPQITEYPVAAPSPALGLTGITTAPDGALWFVEAGSSVQPGAGVGRITTTGSVTTFPIAPGDALPYPWGFIAVGSDGAMWLPCCSSTGDGGLKRITTAGAMQNFVIATTTSFTALSSPGTISPGPDGALWFGQWCCNAEIGRMTTSGVLTSFPVGKFTDVQYTSSVFGPDQALWLVGIHQSTSSPVVLRVTTNGSYTDYSGAAAAAGVVVPAIVTTGPDGALWFTDYGAGANLCCGTIDRVTTAGRFSVYRLAANTQPGGITAGPDGALWFTDLSHNAVGRITTRGAITTYAAGISPGASPNQITTGPDKALWFTESGNNRIGRLAIPGVSAPSAKTARSPR